MGYIQTTAQHHIESLSTVTYKHLLSMLTYDKNVLDSLLCQLITLNSLYIREQGRVLAVLKEAEDSIVCLIERCLMSLRNVEVADS